MRTVMAKLGFQVDSINGSMADYNSTERYLDMLGKAKVRGYLFEQQNYIKKQE